MRNKLSLTLAIALVAAMSACGDMEQQANIEPATDILVDDVRQFNERSQAPPGSARNPSDEKDRDQNSELNADLPVEPEMQQANRPVARDQGKRLDANGLASGRLSDLRTPAAEAIARKMLPEQFAALHQLHAPSEPINREKYAHYEDNPVKRVIEHPVSTFSIDVDTGAYANVRRMLQSGSLPPKDAVRAEELINYFAYDYPVPASAETPFALVKEIAPAPWREGSYLLHLGIQGYELPPADLPAANLVFLIDVSGSMQSPDKLELLKTSLKLLVKQLTADDRVALVVYAGASGVVLEPTPGNEHARIIAALDQLQAGGRTNGAAGIRLAYAMAEQGFIRGGINRVLIATDGDFNVGTVDHEQLKNLIEEKRNTGISLSTLGFGTGNYNDQLMEQLADVGNGNYAYIDTIKEAQKVLVDEMSSTLMTIAKDVKIQIEFNPAVVAEYRLIGYENRQLRREDFNNDKVDAGEIGAGHSVTALYEISLTDSTSQRSDPLRYQPPVSKDMGGNDEIAYLKIRYKAPAADNSQLLSWEIDKSEIMASVQQTSDAFRFSAAVAAFAQQLRGGEMLEDFSWDQIRQLAGTARGTDPYGYRGEFLSLVNLARSLGTTYQQKQDTPSVSRIADPRGGPS